MTPINPTNAGNVEMNADQLAMKLSNLEGMITQMSKRFERVEEAIDKVVTLDRSVAEIVVRHENQQREMRELAHDVKNCQQSHKAATEALVLRISGLEKEHYEFKNKTAGVLLALKIFSGVCASLVVLCASWVYNRVEANTLANIEQQQAIRLLERGK